MSSEAMRVMREQDVDSLVQEEVTLGHVVLQVYHAYQNNCN